LDATAALPPGERKEIAEFARRRWDWNRRMIHLWTEMYRFHRAHKEQFRGLEPNARVRDEWNAYLDRVKKLGVEFRGFPSGAGGHQAHFHVPRNSAARRANRRLTELGLMWGHWVYFGPWEGITYPTPVSDGERVITVTAHNLYSCYDMDGRLLWLRRFPPADKADLSAEQLERVTPQGKRRRRGRWPHGWPGQGHFSTSPVMVDGKVISQAGMWVRCLDAGTGKVLWAHPLRGTIGQNMAVPAVVELEGTKAVITSVGEKRVGPDGDDVYRLSDGKLVGVLPGTTSAKLSVAGPILSGDVVVHFSGHWRDRTVHGTRLMLEGDGDEQSLETRSLWSMKKNRIRNFSLWRAVLHDGKLYYRDVVLDADTGKVLATGLPTARRRYAWWSCLVVGENLLTIDHDRGEFLFRDLKTGKKTGQASLPVNPPGGASDELKWSQTRFGPWPVLGAGSPFAARDRLYVRSFDYLWCIGRRAE
jgi:outer membrane protein assembly factor BamB